jgi:hypothetical protein
VQREQVRVFEEVNHFALARPGPALCEGRGYGCDRWRGLEQLQPKAGEYSRWSITSRPPLATPSEPGQGVALTLQGGDAGN